MRDIIKSAKRNNLQKPVKISENGPAISFNAEFHAKTLHQCREINFQKKEIKKEKNNRKKYLSFFLFSVAYLIALSPVKISFLYIYFVILFIITLRLNLNSRWLFQNAFWGLILIIIFSAGEWLEWWSKTTNLNEKIAICVYFFLVVGVLKQIKEIKKSKDVSGDTFAFVNQAEKGD